MWRWLSHAAKWEYHSEPCQSRASVSTPMAMARSRKRRTLGSPEQASTTRRCQRKAPINVNMCSPSPEGSSLSVTRHPEEHKNCPCPSRRSRGDIGFRGASMLIEAKNQLDTKQMLK